jgi:hypothetical protein
LIYIISGEDQRDSVKEEVYMDVLKRKDVESLKGNESVEKKWIIKVGVQG